MEFFIKPGREADTYRPPRDCRQKMICEQSLGVHLRAKKMGKTPPPYFPQWELLPLHEQAKLALLWREAGFLEEAAHLSAWLLKLEPFPSLWCPEKKFDEEEISQCFSKLREIDPSIGKEPDCNLTCIQTEKIWAALTLDGEGTSLGVVRAGVEIRAFGPQAENMHFGIQGKGMNGWTRMASHPEIWLEMKPRVVGEGLGLDFRFVGVKPENPLSLAFYVKAQSCEIGEEVLKPKSLHRFLGEVQNLQFEKKCRIEFTQPHKVQVIPLAGEGCFWGAEFLFSLVISPFAPQISLCISVPSGIAK